MLSLVLPTSDRGATIDPNPPDPTQPNPHSDRGATVDVRFTLVDAPGEVPPRRVEVSVEDNGVGIADETKAALFQPFAQAQRLTGGTGCVWEGI